jgi:hypothetical protein
MGHEGGSATPKGQNPTIFFSCHGVVEPAQTGQGGHPSSVFQFIFKILLFYYF